MSDIQNHLEVVQQRIANACKQVHRNRDSVKLLLATKTVAPNRIQEAFKIGYTLIGENKVQEVKEKFDALRSTPHELHFIGHLQTNKVRDVLKFGVNCIQSLDRISLAEKLHQRLVSENKTMTVLIQVNTSGEPSKFGVAPLDAVSFVEQVSSYATLKIRGLMTIALFSAEIEKVRLCFRLLKSLQNQISRLNLPGVEMEELSMGMSHDFETAIEEGATIVRVGTAVFGSRIYPDSYYWNEQTSADHGSL